MVNGGEYRLGGFVGVNLVAFLTAAYVVVSSFTGDDCTRTARVSVSIRGAALGRMFERVREGDRFMVFCLRRSMSSGEGMSLGIGGRAMSGILSGMLTGAGGSCLVSSGRVFVAGGSGVTSPNVPTITRRGVAIGKIMASVGNRGLPNTAIMMRNAPEKTVASVSNACAVSMGGGRGLAFSCLKVTDRAVTIKSGGVVGMALGRGRSVLRRMAVITFKGRGGRDMVSSVRAMRIGSLEIPSDGLAATLSKHVTKIVSCRADNRPKRSGTRFFVHNMASFNTKGMSPLVLVSGIRMSSGSLSQLRPSSVRDFSVLGSTATATLCNTHNTGNMVLIAAGRKGRKGVGISFHMRGSFSSPAGGVRVTSPVACVQLTGRTMATQGPLTPMPCSGDGVSGAVHKAGRCTCPTMS